MNLLKVSFKTFLIFAVLPFIFTKVAAIQKTDVIDSVKIGLLIPENKSLAARYGAEMAIRSSTGIRWKQERLKPNYAQH